MNLRFGYGVLSYRNIPYMAHYQHPRMGFPLFWELHWTEPEGLRVYGTYSTKRAAMRKIARLQLSDTPFAVFKPTYYNWFKRSGK